MTDRQAEKQAHVAERRREQAKATCLRIQARRNDLKRREEELQTATKMTVLAAHDSGLTYEEIAEAIGLSRPRISQMLQEARKEEA